MKVYRGAHISVLINLVPTASTDVAAKMQETMALFLGSLRCNPWALEAAWISVAHINPDGNTKLRLLCQLQDIHSEISLIENAADANPISHYGEYTLDGLLSAFEHQITAPSVILLTNASAESLMNARVLAWMEKARTSGNSYCVVAPCGDETQLNSLTERIDFDDTFETVPSIYQALATAVARRTGALLDDDDFERIFVVTAPPHLPWSLEVLQ